jgi:hypothetical protein
MRNIICLFAVTAIMMSCSQPGEGVEANGFSPRGNEIKMGSQESVDLIVKMDEFWSAKDYDSMRELIADSATFYFYSGEAYNSADELMAGMKNNPIQYNWEMTWAFAIKDDNPEIKGEWVNAGFDLTETNQEGEEKDFLVNDWYYVENGKIQRFFNVAAEIKE